MLRARLALVALAVLVAAPACARDKAEPAAPTTIERTEEIPVTVSVKLGGDLVGAVENTTVRSQLVMRKSNDPQLQGSRIFGVETLDPLVAGNVAFTAGFAVLPYEGDGKYTIGKGSINDPANTEGKSSVKVIYWPEGLTKDAYDYLRRVEPCRVEIERDGSEGRIDCPRLTNELRDKHFSLDMRWKFAAP